MQDASKGFLYILMLTNQQRKHPIRWNSTSLHLSRHSAFSFSRLHLLSVCQQNKVVEVQLYYPKERVVI